MPQVRILPPRLNLGNKGYNRFPLISYEDEQVSVVNVIGVFHIPKLTLGMPEFITTHWVAIGRFSSYMSGTDFSQTRNWGIVLKEDPWGVRVEV
jgi:hypothetical protein